MIRLPDCVQAPVFLQVHKTRAKKHIILNVNSGIDSFSDFPPSELPQVCCTELTKVNQCLRLFVLVAGFTLLFTSNQFSSEASPYNAA